MLDASCNAFSVQPQTMRYFIFTLSSLKIIKSLRISHNMFLIIFTSNSPPFNSC